MIDFDVLFGLEHHYGDGKEVLIYGIGVLVHAHPHRARFYINQDKPPRYDVCDGIEVYNAADEMIINEKAMRDAERLPLFKTSGGDVHENYNTKKV